MSPSDASDLPHRRRARAVVLTLALATAATACTDDDPTVQPYDPAPVPAVPDRTAEVTEGAGLADGEYWTTGLELVGSSTLRASLVQAWFGPACLEELGEEACAVEPGVDDRPTVSLDIDPQGVRMVTVVDDDRRNYSIPSAELVRLVAGEAPGAGAPDGFRLDDSPFLVTIRAGVATEITQVWVG